MAFLEFDDARFLRPQLASGCVCGSCVCARRNPTNISDFFYFNGSSPASGIVVGSGMFLQLTRSVCTGDTGPGWAHRPVSVVVGVDGDLFVTSDRSGVVLRIWRK